jgi:hypothetical protein
LPFDLVLYALCRLNIFVKYKRRRIWVHVREKKMGQISSVQFIATCLRGELGMLELPSDFFDKEHILILKILITSNIYNDAVP